jgi:trimeric autotransporter adhesin
MKMKIYFRLFLFLLFGPTYAQVGVGTVTPNAQLEIASSNQVAPANTDGILIPKVDAFPATNPTVAQQGMLVYLTTTSGSNAPGFYYWNNPSTSWIGIQTNAKADWNILGNTGTNPATNFLGTIDDKDIVFKRYNTRAGLIGNPDTSTGNMNTSFGANTLNPATTGTRNTAIGTNVMPSNTSGNINVAIGERAMFTNTIGVENVAVGVGSLYTNLNGNYNTAVGRNALTSNSGGASNTALGYATLSFNTNSFNTAVGRDALRTNSTGSENTASGVNALYANVGGIGNSAYGVKSLRNATGSYNVGLGYESLFSNTGDYNVGIGYQAGYNETGSNRLYIENSNADASNALIYGEFDNNIVRANGTLQIGNPTTTGYALPTSRGTNTYVLQTNGSGSTSWVAASTLAVTETDPQVSSATTNAIPKWNGTTLVDGVAVDDGTNIGVGVTPSAGNKLEVNGKTKTTTFQMTNGATANYVLQSDATGNASWALPNNTLSIMRSSLSANQTLGTGGWQKITFNTVVFDLNSELNTGTNRFVAAKTGYYEVNTGYHTDNQSNSQYYSIGIYKNGTLYQQVSGNHTGTGLVFRHINCIMALTAGDYVEVYVENYQSSVIIDGFSGKTFFEVKQLR